MKKEKMNVMKRIVKCNQCNGYEYYGDMHWRNGTEMCRNCYKSLWEKEHNQMYNWNDLDGYVPTKEDFIKQEENK